MIECKFCGTMTDMLGTKMCNNCYEVEGRLSKFLRSEAGREYAAKLLDEALIPKSMEITREDAKSILDGFSALYDREEVCDKDLATKLMDHFKITGREYLRS